jgi:uncharacterized protein (DUF2147 family)
MRQSWIAGAAALLCVGSGGASADESSPAGFWVTPEGGAVVEIAACPSGLCGHLVGLRADHAANEVMVDNRNPDPSKRNNPRCGLMLMGSMKPAKSEPGKWEDGWVYDPESGNTYTGYMRLDGPNTLKLRGYVGISLFGRTETWTRETGENKNRCTPPTRS